MNATKPTFLFLCGVGRSGTTALRTSLGTHPQIYYNGFENNIVQDIVEVAHKNFTMQSRKNAMAVSQSDYDSHFRVLIRSLLWPDESLAQRPIHMAAINPTPIQLDYMTQLFPGSKFIGLIRNGIEVVSSRTEYRSFAKHEFASHCDVWNRSAAVFKWGQNNLCQFLEVRQEWFYAPEQLQKWNQKFCSWLGVAHSDEPMQKILNTLRHPTSGGFTIQHKDFSSTELAEKQKYFLSKRDRWQGWTKEQRDIFAERCGDNMRLLGYDLPWDLNAN